MKHYTLILLLSVVNLMYSQNQIPEHYDCPTSSFVNAEKFKSYYESDELDSAQLILNDWVEKCGNREVVIRAQMLLKLTNGADIDIDGTYFHRLIDFIQRDTVTGIRAKYYYEYNLPYYGYIPISESYDKFTKEAFRRIGVQNTDEKELIRQVYLGNHTNFFEKVSAAKLKGSPLQETYNDLKIKSIDLTEGHYSIFTGLWIPLNNTTLGTHPEIGFQVGAKRKRWNYDLTILFRFLKSKNEYEALRKQTNNYETTNRFFGGYMGLEAGYDIITEKSSELQIVGGLGFDGFDALEQSGELNAVSTFSYNFNIGVKFRKYINANAYIGVGTKYNIVDYSAGDKVKFNEYPIAINFIYGFVGNRIKSQKLNYINYRLRE